MKVHHSHLANTFKVGICLLGIWSLYAQLCVLWQVDFTTLKRYSALPLLALPLILHALRSSLTAPPQPRASSEARAPFITLPPWYRIAAPFLITLIYVVSGAAWLLWILAVVHLALEAIHTHARSPTDQDADVCLTMTELVILLAIGMAAVLITSGACRPDADDAYFVNVAASSLDHPDLPLLAFDGMHGCGFPPVEQTLHLTGVYELLIAVTAAITGVSVRVLYYLIFPAFWAALSILSHWILLRRFLPRHAALFGTLALVAVLVLWGDGHRTFGNFGFVRLFQGKAAFLLVVVPALLDAALQYRSGPTRLRWLTLMLAQCAATGLTTNALVLAPLAVGLALVAAPRFTRAFAWRAISGLATSIPLVLLAAGMHLRLSPYRMSLDVDPARIGYAFLLGDYRFGLVLLSLLSLPVLSSRFALPRASWLAGYVWLAFLVLFCPVVPNLLGQTVSNVFTWRLFWALPIPFLLGLSLGALVSSRLQWRGLGIGLSALWLVAFGISGEHAVSSYNWSWHNMGKFKVKTEPFEIARHVMHIADTDGIALAPESVATYLCGFRGTPPLIGVSQLYLTKMEGVVSKNELVIRARLLAYIGGVAKVMSVDECVNHITNRNVATVVFPDTHPHRQMLQDALAAQQFTLTCAEHYTFATKPDPQGSCPTDR